MQVEKIKTVTLDKKVAKAYAAEVAGISTGRKVKKTKYLGGGSFGRAFLIEFADGSKIVVKFLRAADMLEKEVYDLKLLAENCSVKMPAVLFVRKAGGKIPVDCYGMEYIEGKPAFTSFGMLFLSKQKRLEFANKVTSALHSVHCCTNEKFGDTRSPGCAEWTDYYKPFAKAVYDKAEEEFRNGNLSEKIIAAMRAAWENFDVIFSEKVVEACLIHGDLNIANIMVGKDYKLRGFIDPLNSAFADREYDLFQFDNLTGKRFFFREVYALKYGASKNVDAKCAFYGLWNEVYCYIKSGVLVGIIMNPLVKNMNAILSKL